MLKSRWVLEPFFELSLFEKHEKVVTKNKKDGTFATAHFCV